jgi:Carboxypeptidase regulatory-like domain
MLKRPFTSAGLIVALMMPLLAPLLGCDREEGRARPAKIVPMEYSDVPTDMGAGGGPSSSGGAPPGKGVIKGKLMYTGAKPALKSLGGPPCHAGAPAVLEDWLLVNDKNELANVVVYLKEPPAVDMPPPPAPVIDQKNCVYVPHVVAMQAGQTLKVTSSDPTTHNFHTLGTANAQENLAMGPNGSSSTRMRTAEFKPPVRVKCDVHPWMSGYVAVFEHPFFAVTKNDGTFEIKGLPPGEYTVVFWHEKLKGQEQSVKVAEDKPSEMSVTLAQ